MTLQREIRFNPILEGYQANRVEFLLHGQQGTIQFVFMLNLDEEAGKSSYPNYSLDVGYHWDKKFYKGQYKSDKCEFRERGTCRYDGSGLRAMEWMKILREKGSEAIWPLMEQYYKELCQEYVEV